MWRVSSGPESANPRMRSPKMPICARSPAAARVSGVVVDCGGNGMATFIAPRISLVFFRNGSTRPNPR